jgi:biofilm PGA synthesis N-glycosyltransferase PgaC
MLAVWIIWGFAILYACLQGYYLYYWIKTPAPQLPATDGITAGVSIVIVARNESTNIQACLKSILKQNLSKELYEIIIVDDHSTDDTLDKIREIDSEQIQSFRLKDYPEYIYEPAYKKSGITLAVDKAKFLNIMVTDADCMYGEDWLSNTLNGFQQSKSVFQTGPVLLSNSDTLLEKMQEAEQLTLMLITGAGISSGLHDIASGANMLFSKTAFKKVKGYEGNYH